MDATVFFTDSQARWNESQKKITELWDESQKQLMDSQKQLVDIWMSNMTAASPQVDFVGNYEKALNFQRELVNSAINAQQVSFRFAVESQRQLWDDYFQATHSLLKQTSDK